MLSVPARKPDQGARHARLWARPGLARAYAMQRDTAKARAAYYDFLTRGRTPTLTSLL
jgi:hypothetical protein